jgi:hypothetical protein
MIGEWPFSHSPRLSCYVLLCVFSEQDDGLVGWPDTISADSLMNLETYKASFSVKFDQALNGHATCVIEAEIRWDFSVLPDCASLGKTLHKTNEISKSSNVLVRNAIRIEVHHIVTNSADLIQFFDK